MKFINIQSNDVYTNLATEEYFLKHKPMDLFMLWINDNCIVIGKNQNSHKEINKEYIEQNNIKIVRRMSGGGAVFHDLGNICFTFIKSNSSNDFLNFGQFIKPIISVLKKLGIEAEASGRNDILIKGKKFSGNAQYVYNDWLLHHGTIMFSVTMSHIMKALNVNTDKIKSKGIDSVKSRVTNIVDHLKEKITIEDFRDMITKEIFKMYPEIEEYGLSDKDKIEIEKLRKNKYSTWDYIFGKNPKYEINNAVYVESVGTIDIYLNIEKSLIKEIKIYGDFFAKEDIDFIEKKLVGIKHNYEDVLNQLKTIENFGDYFFNLKIEQLAEIISHIK